jgi:hypothetical protein
MAIITEVYIRIKCCIIANLPFFFLGSKKSLETPKVFSEEEGDHSEVFYVFLRESTGTSFCVELAVFKTKYLHPVD